MSGAEPASEAERAAEDVQRLIGACCESPERARALLAAEPELIARRTGLGETALHWFAYEGDLERVALLAACGADVNTVSGLGMTPLGDAAHAGREDLVAWLFAHGARIDRPEECSPTLHHAVDGGNTAIVAMMLARGADVDASSRRVGTALHVAAVSDERLGVLHQLLQAGADVTRRCRLGRAARVDESALDVARRRGAWRAAELLEAAGRALRAD